MSAFENPAPVDFFFSLVYLETDSDAFAHPEQHTWTNGHIEISETIQGERFDGRC